MSSNGSTALPKRREINKLPKKSNKKNEEYLGPILEARKVLEIEAQAVADLKDRISDNFEKAVGLIFDCQGKVIISGIGKSGLICQKIASTLSSTGTPAIFLHPSEGMHGDLGIIARGDVMVAVSNSGETEEILNLLPLVRRMGNKLIAFTGKPQSTLARVADVVIDVGVKEEACPLGLAPTASTTATLAMGDALAVSLLKKRGFSEEDFALVHPGGILGRKLLLKVKDLMHTGEEIPIVNVGILMKEAILEITSKKMGVTGVINDEGTFVGVVTDGDLRRGLEKHSDLLSRTVSEIMTPNPKRINADALAARALQVMEKHAITSLFVFENDREDQVKGIVHMHDLLRAGIA